MERVEQRRPKSTKARVAFYTLGCKLNFSETATISRDFNTDRFEQVAFDSPAEVYVINTCSVTENADRKFKGLVKKALRQNPDAFIAAIGCYAQLQPQELAEVSGVDLVLGATEKFKLIDYLGDLTKKPSGAVHSCEIGAANYYESSFSLDDRTRAFLKVQDGCDYKCTYCTIPRARGISRSDSLENIIKQALLITEKGIKEIVLTGVNIGDYGKGEFGNKKHEHTFLDLITALDQIEALKRIRISSIEPNLLSDKVIDFVANSRAFVPHFHIPLQSGSDKILRKMKRRYLSGLYRDRVAQIKSLMPNACIGGDVIVGFPGETDEAFLETYNFIAGLDISYLHVFSYSERPNTEAITMGDVVPLAVRNKRSKMLRGLSAKKRRSFYEAQLGEKVNVLFEHENKKGYITGFSENYIKVRAPWDPHLANRIENLLLQEIDPEGYVRTENKIKA
ncbi:MAG TPA: tRNA (N(6)-L-threonylcarbamoyladenosine(37)-C(2))-methylthiotransferase MtaB [Flavobacteriaceae bacterium]|nr:tRNA (N(6)-L-threonylcarbamoyladenosine(37)-C(2))-methylthiotransferase MtaB [Flavobacteriaceae bacterium]|tara:strand:- start:3931 stop:5283 length:1353 start_codon:yes stop_codon:yes gene_type:complete